MAKSFKKNQPIVATLPSTGRVVNGYYIESYGVNCHSFYVDEYEGERGGKPIYKKVRYGVSDEFIEAVDSKSPAASDAQYKAWLKRAMVLEERIAEDKKNMKALEALGGNDKEVEKLKKKIERSQSKLEQINVKINEYEGEE